jgi:hypothetical protein
VKEDTYFFAVDVFNSATSNWSLSQLSVGRAYLAAAATNNVAIFAGGQIADGGVL